MVALPSKLAVAPWFAACAVVAALIPSAVGAMAWTPADTTMGDVQRILYIHVPVAWTGLLAFGLMTGAGVGYLLQRDLRWDHWAQPAAELGWLFSGLTLATGSLWAHSAWGAWWTADPRLTSSFILWLIYTGCLLVRGGIRDAHRRARISAVLACLGGLDIPLVIMATRWFRGIHPVAPEMEPIMHGVLLLSAAGMVALFVLLLWVRRAQVQFEESLQTAHILANARDGSPTTWLPS